MEFKWSFIAITTIGVSAFISMSFTNYQQTQLGIKAMDQGYVQCQEVSVTSSNYKEILWKKACK